jgi:hypothetical protein
MMISFDVGVGGGGFQAGVDEGKAGVCGKIEDIIAA